MRGPELEAAVDATLDEIDLATKRDTPCGQLSKGMRQRVLIGRCLLHRPDLLILDEPADGLDPRGRNELRHTLARVRDSGVTVIVSSHILRELDELCDHVAIIQRGRLVVSGRVHELVHQYDVARFVYEIRTLSCSDFEVTRSVLSRHPTLIEGHGTDDGLNVVRVQVRGDESLMADILTDLVSSGVKVVTVNRQRSRLEDVYDKLSDDHVN